MGLKAVLATYLHSRFAPRFNQQRVPLPEQTGMIMLEPLLQFCESEGVIFAVDRNGYFPSKGEFERFVKMWRKFYDIFPDEDIENWNKIVHLRNQTPPPGKPLGRPGYVYLAYAETGHYKIGRSADPPERIKVFDTKMPIKVELIHTIEADDVIVAESRLHQIYADKHHEGEWFNLTELDVDEIKAIDEFASGEFL